MEPEGSLPPSQVSATCACPEPDQSVMLPFHFLKSLFNNILPFMPRFSKWALSLWVPQPCMHLSSSQDVPCALPRSADDKFFIMHSSPLLCYVVPLLPKYVPQHPILRPSQPVFVPQCETPSFMPMQTRVSLYLRVSVMRLLCYWETLWRWGLEGGEKAKGSRESSRQYCYLWSVEVHACCHLHLLLLS